MAQKFGGGGFNPQALMKQAQEMQKKIAEAQEELADSEVDGTAGNGMVLVTMDGKKSISAVKINPAVVDPDDVEMLEDLIIAAINDASRQIDELQEEIMAPFAGMGGLL